MKYEVMFILRCLKCMFASFARLNLSRWAATQIDFLAFHDAMRELMNPHGNLCEIDFCSARKCRTAKTESDRCWSIQIAV